MILSNDYGGSYSISMDNNIFIEIDVMNDSSYICKLNSEFYNSILSYGKYSSNADTLYLFDEVYQTKSLLLFGKGKDSKSYENDIFYCAFSNSVYVVENIKNISEETYKSNKELINKHNADLVKMMMLSDGLLQNSQIFQFDINSYYAFLAFSKKDISLMFNIDNSYEYSLLDMKVSTGRWSKHNNIITLIDSKLGVKYSLVVVNHNQIVATHLPMFYGYSLNRRMLFLEDDIKLDLELEKNIDDSLRKDKQSIDYKYILE